MNHKVLLADDSVTIQKVIKITLANQPYEITDAASETDLFNKLKGLDPKLVLLDFNLSEKFSGYELTSKIKSICPNTKVLLLLGTFDSVDEEAMTNCGASDKIVKPFDSNKFIAICRQLVDSDAHEDIPYPEEKKAAPNKTMNDEEQWTVSHSTEQKTPEPVTHQGPIVETKENPLLKEVSSWGMSVPGIINSDKPSDKMSSAPPVIGAEVHSLNQHKTQKQAATKEDPKFPQNEDLDYPTIEESMDESQSLGGTADDLIKSTTSKVISIETFNEELLELELQEPSQIFETDVKSLEAQILDEVQDNLWKADEFEDLKKEVSSKIEEVKNNFQPTLNDFDESLFKSIDDSSSITWNDNTPSSNEKVQPSMASPISVDQAEMKKMMEEMVKKYVKEYMDQMFQKNTEKVAWEVIPDLAENLIRQELSKISHKILNDQP
jgi:DNA-binding response OmpR family regulator